MPLHAVESHTYGRLLGPVAFEPPHMAGPVYGMRVSMGFPSPADDFLDDDLDLNEFLIRNPPATFRYRAEGDSMMLAGICDGDVLLVDRSVQPQNGDLVLATWGGLAPVCKILRGLPVRIELHSANAAYAPLLPPPDEDVEVFAIVGIARQIVRGNRRCVRTR
jgi:DNA polymerase V